jgi:hypothetical protein
VPDFLSDDERDVIDLVETEKLLATVMHTLREIARRLGSSWRRAQARRLPEIIARVEAALPRWP